MVPTSPAPIWTSVDVVVDGVRISFESDIRACLDAVLAVYGPAAPGDGRADCHLRIVRRPDAALDLRPAGIHWTRPEPWRATVSAPGLDALLDVSEGLAIVHVDEAFVRNESQFRRTVLEDIVTSLLRGTIRSQVRRS